VRDLGEGRKRSCPIKRTLEGGKGNLGKGDVGVHISREFEAKSESKQPLEEERGFRGTSRSLTSKLWGRRGNGKDNNELSEEQPVDRKPNHQQNESESKLFEGEDNHIGKAILHQKRGLKKIRAGDKEGNLRDEN